MRLSSSSKTALKVSLLAAILFAFSSCAKKPEPTFASTKQHMIESDRLDKLMHELNMVVYNRPKSELEKDELRRRYALRYAKTLKELAQNVENLHYDQHEKELTQDDKRLYTSFAKRLYKNAQDIQSVASKYELEKLNIEMKRANATCNSCHLEFRGGL